MKNRASSSQKIEYQEFNSFNPLLAEYEGVEFHHCDFSDCDLSEIQWIDCAFYSCNLSMAPLQNTSFQNVQFMDCKMMGLHFEDTNDFIFEVNFKNCNLNFSCFFQRNLKGVLFENCSLHEVDFTQSDLSLASFNNSDLHLATFKNCILEKTDFRSALNYQMDLSLNKVKKAKFSRENLTGLLVHFDLVIE
jgi:fluoroquinolone resistance protein